MRIDIVMGTGRNLGDVGYYTESIYGGDLQLFNLIRKSRVSTSLHAASGIAGL